MKREWSDLKEVLKNGIWAPRTTPTPIPNTYFPSDPEALTAAYSK